MGRERAQTLHARALLKDILGNWRLHQMIDSFRDDIIGSIKVCIRNDDQSILWSMLNYFYAGYMASTRNEIMIDFINITVQYARVNCCNILLARNSIIEPICLEMASEYHPHNTQL